MKASLRRLFAVSFCALTGPLVLLVSCQSKLIYHPQRYSDDWLERFERSGGERVVFTTSQGEQTAFYRPCASGKSQPRRLWLCFAGNASLALLWEELPGAPHPDDALLMVDYPGYGLCEGKPNPARIRESARGALQTLVSERLEGRQPALGLLGHSLGAAAILLAAQDFHADRLILLSPFTSLMDMGNRLLFPPLGHLTLHRFDNLKALADAAVPPGQVLIFHGDEDEIIPVEMGRRLAASRPEARFVVVPGARHNDLFEHIGEAVREAMNEP